MQERMPAVKAEARRIMDKYRTRIAGSYISEGPFSIAWNYRHSDPDWAQSQSNFMVQELKDGLTESFVKVCPFCASFPSRNCTTSDCVHDDRVPLCLALLHLGKLTNSCDSSICAIWCIRRVAICTHSHSTPFQLCGKWLTCCVPPVSGLFPQGASGRHHEARGQGHARSRRVGSCGGCW